MYKISLVINSYKPTTKKIEDILAPIWHHFDEIVLYVDSQDDFEITRYSNLKFFSGSGRSAAQGFNYAISKSTGKIILPFCDDDYFHVENLKKALAHIREGKMYGYDILFSRVTLDWHWPTPLMVRDFTLEDMKKKNRIPFSSFYHRHVFDELKGYDESIGAYDDWHFWLRAKKHGFKFQYFQKPIYHFSNCALAIEAFRKPCGTLRLLEKQGGHDAAVNRVLTHI